MPASSRVARDLQAEGISFFEQRNDDFFGGSGVGGAFEDDQLALVQVRRDGLHGAGDVAQIGLVILVERRGHADDDGIHAGRFRSSRLWRESRISAPAESASGKNAHDVGAAGIQCADLSLLDVEPGDLKALAAEEQRQWQADVAHSDDADACLREFLSSVLSSARDDCCCCGHRFDCKGRKGMRWQASGTESAGRCR